MNRGDFIQLVENSNSIQNGQIIDLQSIIQEFPYFQTGQLLLSKAFQNTENINFEKQLRKTAAFAANRKVLHELLFQQKAEMEESPEIENEVDIQVSEADMNTEIFEQPEEVVESNLSDEKPLQVVSTLEVPIEEKIESLANKFEDSKIEPELEEKDRTLEQQILSAAISSSIFLEVSDEINLEGLQTSPKESFEPQVRTNFKKVVQEDTFSEQTAHSFSDWLSHYSDKAENPSLHWEKETDSEETYSYVESNLPTKNEFYSPAKMARLSVQENDDLVTETLANIYADQGSFEKAIKAFQKLQLKYPEKKIYFAARIKEIENQLNSQ